MQKTQKYRQVLEDKKRELKVMMDRLQESSRESLQEATRELSRYDNHPADLGSETFERSKDHALYRNYLSLLSKVDHSLNKIDDGTYGICEQCGKPIDQDRLSVVPYSSFCIECQRENGSLKDDSPRPVEEDLLWPPFGRTFQDGTDKNFYDGEDAWQDVAKYGTSESPQDVPGSRDYQDIYRDADEDHGVVDRMDKAWPLNGFEEDDIGQ